MTKEYILGFGNRVYACTCRKMKRGDFHRQGDTFLTRLCLLIVQLDIRGPYFVRRHPDLFNTSIVDWIPFQQNIIPALYVKEGTGSLAMAAL